MKAFVEASANMALHHFKMAPRKAIILWLLVLLTAEVQYVLAVDANCNFNNILEPEQTYYINNTGFPHRYPTPSECMWNITTPDPGSQIRLICAIVDLPCSDHCTTDNITVYLGNGIVRTHSGKKLIFEQSMGNGMSIIFSAKSKYHGRFLCALQVITQEDQKCICGWKNPARIVGGNETDVNEYTMMAAIVNPDGVHCGGTIIAEKHVLTAAHCVQSYNMSDGYRLVVGEHDIRLENETTATEEYAIIRVDIHPEYDSAGDGNDVALLTLNASIKFGNAIGPVCLPFYQLDDLYVGDIVTLLGWGTIEFGGPKSPTLQKTKVSVVSTSDCRKSYPKVTEKQLCTFANRTDACQFDSGGPCLRENPTSKRQTLVGIISSGIGCAGNDPGLNQRVGSSMDWILYVTLNAGVKLCTNY